MGKLKVNGNKGGTHTIACWTVPAWKYSHSEQVVSQVLLQLQSPVFEAISFGWSARPSEQAGQSVAGEQHSAGQV